MQVVNKLDIHLLANNILLYALNSIMEHNKQNYKSIPLKIYYQLKVLKSKLNQFIKSKAIIIIHKLWEIS